MKPGNLQECARCQFRQRMALKDEIRTSLPHLRMRFYFCQKRRKKQMNKRLFTSESVTEGHPDKVCDCISDSVLDAMLGADPQARVACECAATTGMVLVMGEVTTGLLCGYPPAGAGSGGKDRL